MNMQSFKEIDGLLIDVVKRIQCELHIENGHDEYVSMLRMLGRLAEAYKELETIPRVEILL